MVRLLFLYSNALDKYSRCHIFNKLLVFCIIKWYNYIRLTKGGFYEFFWVSKANAA